MTGDNNEQAKFRGRGGLVPEPLWAGAEGGADTPCWALYKSLELLLDSFKHITNINLSRVACISPKLKVFFMVCRRASCQTFFNEIGSFYAMKCIITMPTPHLWGRQCTTLQSGTSVTP